MKVCFYAMLFSLLHTSCFTQSLNGTWKGQSERSFFVLNPTEIILDLEIYNDTLISGIIHSYYTKGRFDHVIISGHINLKDSIFYIIDEAEIRHNINTKFFEMCRGTMTLKLTKVDNIYRLKGKWKDNDRKLFHCPTLETVFEKQIRDTSNSDKKDNLHYRKSDIQNIIELDQNETDSIKISNYDNGQIDDDTATVYFNDSLIIKSSKLSQKPIDFYITLDKSIRTHKINLVAENLGSIPPNTALLVITTCKNRYSITLSSDNSKNGTVKFFLKE